MAGKYLIKYYANDGCYRKGLVAFKQVHYGPRSSAITIAQSTVRNKPGLSNYEIEEL